MYFMYSSSLFHVRVIRYDYNAAVLAVKFKFTRTILAMAELFFCVENQSHRDRGGLRSHWNFRTHRSRRARLQRNRCVKLSHV